MKKLFIMAAFVAVATSAFAQDIKSILKAKDYAEAKSQIEACISSLSNEDKAKAYNQLVQISLAKANKEAQTQAENQVMAQMGQQGGKAVDFAGMSEAIRRAMNDALECDKYDNMPNAKGKVAPKFHKKNQAALWNLRVQLFNAGQEAAQKEDETGALENFGAYVDSAISPLFADYDKKTPDPSLGEVARVAAVRAFQAKDIDRANRYCDVSLKDTATYKDALNLKMYIMQSSMKTKEDSIKCLKSFEDIYANDKSEEVFSALANLYGNLNMKDRQMQFLGEHIAGHAGCFNAYALRGQTEMNDSKWDAAIADFKKANESEKKAVVLTYIAFCLNSKAAEMQDANGQKNLFTESIGYLEDARKLDPERKEVNWAYPLYQAYYTVYGADDSRTKEAEGLIK